jgi:hypothetical protein
MTSDEDNYHLQYWIKGGEAGAGILPTSPFVHIVLKTWTGTGADDEMPPAISPQLMTDGEIDHAVDTLVQELEVIRVAAKRALKDRKAQQMRRLTAS